MARFMCSLSILIAAWCILSSNVAAQNSPSTPASCPDATAMANVNFTQLSGSWYEVARSPASSAQCIFANFSVSSDNKTLALNVTSSTSANLSKNMTMENKIDLTSSPTAVYNVSYSMGTPSQNTTLKLLETDYNNYAIVCGYTNASDSSTYFGAVLTRLRAPNNTALTQYETNAATKYTNFTNMANIIQTDKCYTNAASTTLPIFSTLIVALYAILKYLN